ncbi:MAG: magnetosome protein MamC [Candidatus Brocadiales bacterium]|nr:magnetosome protein MamC [Candidatus Brocadiales bacterium]
MVFGLTNILTQVAAEAGLIGGAFDGHKVLTEIARDKKTGSLNSKTVYKTGKEVAGITAAGAVSVVAVGMIGGGIAASIVIALATESAGKRIWDKGLN